ncbi:MAG: hypothetical protein H8F28_27105 [Fibrella sp.]|nr:hypothetical protein [Armatimonadota bacterium]
MLHGEYEKLRQAIQIGLRAVGLDRTVETDGPNRLGGFRLTDGDHCVAISLVPPRKREDRDAGRCWWVSAWMPITDGYESLLSPELMPVPHRREVMLKNSLAYEDAVVAAVQLFAELRMRSAFLNAVKPIEPDMTRPVFPATVVATTSPNIFSTAPNRPDREPAETNHL